jgi:hypothetical protein
MISAITIHFEENREVLINQAVNKCSFFQIKEKLSAVACRVGLSVVAAVMGQFASELERIAGEITGGDFAGLFQVCKKLSFEELPMNLRRSSSEYD